MEHRFAEVLVTDDAVYFDGEELPWYIAKDGIRFYHKGSDDVARLRVEFLVENVSFRPGLFAEHQWRINHNAEWAWLKRAVALEMRVQTRAFDRIEETYARH